MNKRLFFGMIIIVLGVFILFKTITKEIQFHSFFEERTIYSDTIDVNQYSSIEINTKSTNVQVESGLTDQLIVEINGKLFKPEDPSSIFTLESDNNHLAINIDYSKNWLENFAFLGLSVKLTVPSQNLEQFKLDGTSANISVSELTTEDLQVEASSGNIKLYKINTVQGEAKTSSGNFSIQESTADSFAMKSSSGNIKMENIQIKSIEAKATSGNIKMENTSIESIHAKTSSGNIRLNNESASALQIETTSGNQNITVDSIRNDSTLKSSSGNIKVNLTEDPKSLTVQHDKSSGNTSIKKKHSSIENDKNIVTAVFGNGAILLDVETSSGNFTLE